MLRIFNGDVYINWRVRQEYESGAWLRELQETGRVMRSYLDTLEIDFLNTPLIDLDFKLYRLVGPNFHSISFAYALTFFAIVLAAARRWWWPLLVLPPLLVIGSKGALMTLALTLAFLALGVVSSHVPELVLVYFTLAAYACAGIAVGIRAGDYHVIGFIGGLRGFLANPLGRGIGAGGNLSLTVSSFDWSRSQQLGHTDVALESAVGVLLYQMGIAGFVVLGVLFWIVLMLWRQYRLTADRALCGRGARRRRHHGERHLPGGGDVRAAGARIHVRFRRPDAGPRLSSRAAARVTGLTRLRFCRANARLPPRPYTNIGVFAFPVTK